MLYDVFIKKWVRFFYSAQAASVVIALVYIGCAILARETEKSVDKGFELELTTLVTTIFFVIGATLILSAVCGALAQRLKNRPFLWLLHLCLGTLVTFVEFVTSIATLAVVGRHNYAKAILFTELEDYDPKVNPKISKAWDETQAQYECCGVDSYTDWQDVPFGRTTLRTPTSCCLADKRGDKYCNLNVLPDTEDAEDRIFTRGCLEAISEKIDVPLIALGVIGLIMSLAHAVRTYLSCFVVLTKKV